MNIISFLFNLLAHNSICYSVPRFIHLHWSIYVTILHNHLINFRVIEAFIFKVPELIGPWTGHLLEVGWLCILQVSGT